MLHPWPRTKTIIIPVPQRNSSHPTTGSSFEVAGKNEENMSRTQAGSVEIIDQALRSMLQLETQLRTRTKTTIAGPADVYLLLGASRQIMAAWQQSSHHVETWMNAQEGYDRFAIVEGPFTGEPAAAVAITAGALHDARRACADLQASLERAQMAIADLSAPAQDRTAPPTRTNRRFRRGR